MRNNPIVILFGYNLLLMIFLYFLTFPFYSGGYTYHKGDLKTVDANLIFSAPFSIAGNLILLACFIYLRSIKDTIHLEKWGIYLMKIAVSFAFLYNLYWVSYSSSERSSNVYKYMPLLLQSIILPFIFYVFLFRFRNKNRSIIFYMIITTISFFVVWVLRKKMGIGYWDGPFNILNVGSIKQYLAHIAMLLCIVNVDFGIVALNAIGCIMGIHLSAQHNIKN